MLHYRFDVHDAGRVARDEIGVKLADLDAAREAAMRFLPDIARETIPRDGDYRSLVVLVRDEAGRPVNSATLTFTGLRLAS